MKIIKGYLTLQVMRQSVVQGRKEEVEERVLDKVLQFYVFKTDGIKTQIRHPADK